VPAAANKKSHRDNAMACFVFQKLPVLTQRPLVVWLYNGRDGPLIEHERLDAEPSVCHWCRTS
jgi:hypothetical protein